MKSITSTAVAVVAALFLDAQGTFAAAATYCSSSSNDVCFGWGVPEASASSGSGNIYFQIQASTSQQWVGLGTGSRMSGSDMFVIYQDGSGNVTLSTRAGKGHYTPQYTQRSDVELLAGSGVVGGKMIANIRCSECDNLDLGGSNSWIAAWKQGSSLDSSSPSASIQEHHGTDSFKVNFAKATITSDSNPFLNSSSNNSSSSGDGDSDSDGSGSNGHLGSAVTEGSNGSDDGISSAHGIIMSVVFLIGYPIGAVLMPLLGKWLVHAGWQVLAFLGMWAGFGIGYIAADKTGDWWSEPHVQLGTIVCVFIILQPILGYIHHLHYLKLQRRTIVSHSHIWYGRVLMLLGIINGGIGLQLANAPNSYNVAYVVVAVVVFVLYIAGAVFQQMRRPKHENLNSQIALEERRYDSWNIDHRGR